MIYTKLPNTDISVSKICLGTMTFGKQNSEIESHSQIDFSLERGINFLDTAELYPVPADHSTYADTEKIIGSWIKKSGKREKIVLASKIVGPGSYTAHIRKTNHFSPNKDYLHNSEEESWESQQHKSSHPAFNRYNRIAFHFHKYHKCSLPGVHQFPRPFRMIFRAQKRGFYSE